MIKRWAWTWPVLSSVATMLIAGPVRGQGAPPAMPGVPAWSAAQAGAPASPYGPPGYATQGVYLPDAASAQGGYPPGAMLVPAYAPSAPYPGAYAAAMQPAPGVAGPPAGVPGQLAPAIPGTVAPLPSVAVPPGGAVPMPGAMMPGGMPPGAMTPDAYGAYGYMPNQPVYGQPMYDPQGYGGGGYEGAYGGYGGYGEGYDGYGGPPPDGSYPGGAGLFGEGRWLHGGLLGDVLGLVAPYPDGGCAAPRWFDIAVDYVMMKRDNTGRTVPFTSFGITGPIVLSTDNLDFGTYEPGFKLQANLQLGAANSAEFTYLGMLNYTSSAVVRDPTNSLFSVVSQYGLVPFGGFTETDFSDFQQIVYSSKLDSFEGNWRTRWMSPNCRYQGSWTLGVRYLNLGEKLKYHTNSSANGVLGPNGFVPAAAEFNVNSTNSLTGLQVGTDLWICIVPGLRVGGEVQAGVYGNHMNVLTTIGVNDVVANNNPFTERVRDNQVAFVGQVNMLATYRINYKWTARAGYQFMFINGVALATENFNPQPPVLFFPATTRVPTVNGNGDIFLHGWTAGMEYNW